MSDEQQPMTFLDKVEHTFTELRNELVNLFTDHALIHSLTSDAKMKIISHAAEHFGEPTDNVDALQQAYDDLKETHSQLYQEYQDTMLSVGSLTEENESLRKKIQETQPVTVMTASDSTSSSSATITKGDLEDNSKSPS